MYNWDEEERGADIHVFIPIRDARAGANAQCVMVHRILYSPVTKHTGSSFFFWTSPATITENGLRDGSRETRCCKQEPNNTKRRLSDSLLFIFVVDVGITR